jgi:hypothetical protein
VSVIHLAGEVSCRSPIYRAIAASESPDKSGSYNWGRINQRFLNGLFIVGVASLISPIPVTGQEVTIGLMIGFLTTVFIFPVRGNLVEGRRGWLLVALYLFYLGVVLQQQFG